MTMGHSKEIYFLRAKGNVVLEWKYINVRVETC